MKKVATYLATVLVLPLAFLNACSRQQEDPRVAVFERFNRATTYEEAKPLVSGILKDQLDFLNQKGKGEVVKVLNHLKVASYSPRIVEINEASSFLVLENTKPAASEKQAYLLSRGPDKTWTLSNRFSAESVNKTLWTTEYSPAEFNQASNCSISDKKLDPSLKAKEWNMQSAVAIRDKDQIEIDLFPFKMSAADLNHWKFMNMAVDSKLVEDSSLAKPQPYCRIILGLGPANQITFVNFGFDDPTQHYSTLWQNPNPGGAPNKLPANFNKLEISGSRINLETAGTIDAGGAIHWNSKINIPIFEKGL
jgi:hypothetical protein